MTGQAAARAVERAVAHAHIPGDALDQPIRRAGPAVGQRTGLAAAILGDPEVLLLDEPLRALDGAERVSLLRLPGRRRTVVLASRYPASEAGIATHVALVRDGRVAVLARVDELTAHGLPLTPARHRRARGPRHARRRVPHRAPGRRPR